jgi:hypothetical protein
VPKIFSLPDSEARMSLSTPPASTLIMASSISQLPPNSLPLTVSSRIALVSWDTNEYSEPLDGGRNNKSKANDVHLYRFYLIRIFLRQAIFLGLDVWVHCSWFASRVEVLSERKKFTYFGRF